MRVDHFFIIESIWKYGAHLGPKQLQLAFEFLLATPPHHRLGVADGARETRLGKFCETKEAGKEKTNNPVTTATEEHKRHVDVDSADLVSREVRNRDEESKIRSPSTSTASVGMVAID